eukprot:EG_transcript_41558
MLTYLHHWLFGGQDACPSVETSAECLDTLRKKAGQLQAQLDEVAASIEKCYALERQLLARQAETRRHPDDSDSSDPDVQTEAEFQAMLGNLQRTRMGNEARLATLQRRLDGMHREVEEMERDLVQLHGALPLTEIAFGEPQDIPMQPILI